MYMISFVIEHWEKIVSILAFIGVGKLFVDKRTKDANIKKDEAIAEQEAVKVKVENANLSQTFQNMYDKFLEHDKYRTERLESKIEKVEIQNKELEDKYNEILLRNAILEERANTYEEKYKELSKEHIKLKAEYEKLHKENKEFRKEIEDIKRTA